MEKVVIDEKYYAVKTKDGFYDIYENEIKLSKDIPNLYKFYSMNLNSIDSLFRNYFYLSNPANFNDPFDCNINLIKMPSGSSKLKRANYFTNIGVCSFSETINNPLMWAHYSNNYEGFAIDFGNRIETFMQKDQFGIGTLTRVIYLEKPNIIDSTSSFSKHYLLTTKFKPWSYEKEWRMIVQIIEDREMKYDPSLIKGLYIGHKIPDFHGNIYSLILEVHEAKYPTLPIYVVYPHQTKLELKFEKVWPES